MFYNKHGNGTDSAYANYYRIAKFDNSGNAVDSVHDYYLNGIIRLKGIALKIDTIHDTATIWVGRRLMPPFGEAKM